MDAVNPERACRLGIPGVVVDIDGVVRLDPVPLQQNSKNPRIGLDHADLARNHHAPEQPQEIEALGRQRIGLRRPVAERVERHAAIVEGLENGDAAADRALHHLLEAGAMAVRIGINPITWSNDDLPELGGETPLETCLAEAREAGYAGIELGNKFPRESAVLRPILDRHGLALISGWYSARLLERAGAEEIRAVEPHL